MKFSFSEHEAKMKFSFGEHSEMTKALGETIYMAKCNVSVFSLIAAGKTQTEANDRLVKMFKEIIDNGYEQYLTTKA
jgi:hypothetical protein